MSLPDAEWASEPPALRLQGSPRWATMKDVAELAGVSIKTVSRVVNDEQCVRPATRRAVLAAIQDLHFEPNEHTAALRRGVNFKRALQ